MEKKPVKIEGGKLKEFSSVDSLPNQTEIEECKKLISKLTEVLMIAGIEVYDKELLKNFELFN